MIFLQLLTLFLIEVEYIQRDGGPFNAIANHIPMRKRQAFIKSKL